MCCRLFPIRRNSVLSGFSLSLFVDIHDWTEAKHDCKTLSDAAEFPDEKEYRAGYHQHRDDEGYTSPEIMVLIGVVYRVKSKGPNTEP